MMRVIAGSARRINLKTIEGLDTRPTTDRIKETLFNMLQPDLADCQFLDLFAGSGAIGIEALSRGAMQAVFVEQNLAAAACIQENLKKTRLESQAVLMQCDVLTAISRLNGKGYQFDFVFMDPPYGLGLEKQALSSLAQTDLINENTRFVMEASLDTDFTDLEQLGFYLIKEKRYKTNKHVFAARR